MKKFYLLFAVVLFCVSGSAQIINFPDANFKAALLSTVSNPPANYQINAHNNLSQNIEIDANQDNEIEVSEALAVYQITIYTGMEITSLQGIEYFSNIAFLDFENTSVTSFSCTGLSNMWYLRCPNNQLTSINLSGATNLEKLACSGNPLTSIDFTGADLDFLDVNETLLTDLDVSSQVNLTTLYCSFNPLLLHVNLTGLVNLFQLYCAENDLIETLDASDLTSLSLLYCNKNPMLRTILVKNGIDEYPSIHENPMLAYICVDENQLETYQSLITQYGYNCQLNSYCSFNPGGSFYTIEGNNTFDFNSNGCDASDPYITNFKYDISSGTENGSIISNAMGTYRIPVVGGTYTLAPIIENPSYFSVNPPQVNVNFPGAASPYLQNFCITPNGIHSDLEINAVPVNNARPGFDSTYKIIYKNKGTQTQSGIISFAFNDAVLDLVNVNPTVSSQSINALNWNFTDLQPFESREITLTLNANSPQEIPPVNGGDILNFTASANSSLTDETPDDNTFNLNQTVVNSYDPNDKTCLEGSTITPEMVGKEVHYLIRFENTGTANAENVVVKDMIDTAKFDINSLIPIDGSHPFVTRINNTNKVEFIFENINLPFDDANNDGYVAFKIKTKPTLILGDFFSNTASIYFDYNFPIITDPAVTTVAVLAKSDFAFENYFSIYPNPASNLLNIETKTTIVVTSINIYNVLGQVVLVIPNAQQTQSVDVSSLKTGNYLMKVNSDKGSSSVKFVKM